MKFKIAIVCLAFIAVQNVDASPTIKYPDRLFNLFMNKLVRGDQFPYEKKVTNTHLRTAMALLGPPFSDYQKIKGISPLCKDKWRQRLEGLDEKHCKRMYDSLKAEESHRKRKRHGV